eukprot:9402842-Prorocentrum_lima.AAC.1
MTSSLVGSEMCIRDRPRPGPGLSAVLYCSPRLCVLHAAHQPRTCEQGYFCLLYTSDAADDM